MADQTGNRAKSGRNVLQRHLNKTNRRRRAQQKQSNPPADPPADPHGDRARTNSGTNNDDDDDEPEEFDDELEEFDDELEEFDDELEEFDDEPEESYADINLLENAGKALLKYSLDFFYPEESEDKARARETFERVRDSNGTKKNWCPEITYPLVKAKWTDPLADCHIPNFKLPWAYVKCLMYAEARVAHSLVHRDHFVCEFQSGPLVSIPRVEGFQRPRKDLLGDDVLRWHTTAKSLIREDFNRMPAIKAMIEAEIDRFDPRQDMSKSRAFKRFKNVVENRLIPSIVIVEVVRCIGLGSLDPLQKMLEDHGNEYMLWESLFWIRDADETFQFIDPMGFEYPCSGLIPPSRTSKLETDLKHYHSHGVWPPVKKSVQETQIGQLEIQVEVLETKNKDRVLTIKDLRGKVTGLEEEKGALQTQKGIVEAERDVLKAERDVLKADKETLEKQKSDLKAERDDLEAKVTGLEEEKGALQTQKGIVEAERDVFKAERDVLKADKETLEKQKSDLKAERDDLEAKVTGLEEEKGALQTQMGIFEAERDVFKAERDVFKVDNESLQDDNESLQVDNGGLEKEKSDLKTEKDSLKAKVTVLETSKRDLEVKVSNLEAEKGSLEVEKVSLETKVAGLEADIAQDDSDVDMDGTDPQQDTNTIIDMIRQDRSIFSNWVDDHPDGLKDVIRSLYRDGELKEFIEEMAARALLR